MTKLTKLIIATLLLGAKVLCQEINAGKCYVLALSSGQESSAFQAGALQGLLNKLPADQLSYTSVSGNTGGAFNAVILGSHAQGDEAAAVKQMQQFWIDAGNSKLYQNWWGGVIDGLFTKGGIYDSKPMKDFIQKEFVNIQVKRATEIGIVDVLSGQYKPFTEKNLTSGDNLINSLYASFALPGFFPPVEAFGSKWFDGSAVYDLDIFSAVNRCTEKGFKQADIVIDVLLTSSAGLKTVDAHDYKSISMLFRFLEINSYYSSMDGLLRAKFAYPQANFRYAIAPTKSLATSWYPLNLDAKQIQTVINQGIADGQAAALKANGESVEDLIQYHFYKKAGVEMDLGDFVEAQKAGQFEFVDINTDKFYATYRAKYQ